MVPLFGLTAFLVSAGCTIGGCGLTNGSTVRASMDPLQMLHILCYSTWSDW
jgi:hypothetical protein